MKVQRTSFPSYPNWSFGWFYMFLIRVWYIEHDWYKFTGLLWSYDPNFGWLLVWNGLGTPMSRLNIWRLRRFLIGVRQHGSWLEYGTLIDLINVSKNFSCLNRFWKCKELPCPFYPDWGFRGCWRLLIGVPHLIIFWIWLKVFEKPISLFF